MKVNLRRYTKDAAAAAGIGLAGKQAAAAAAAAEATDDEPSILGRPLKVGRCRLTLSHPHRKRLDLSNRYKTRVN